MLNITPALKGTQRHTWIDMIVQVKITFIDSKKGEKSFIHNKTDSVNY